MRSVLRPLNRWISATCIGLAMSSGNALAWPDHPVKLLVGFPAGGVIDVMARAAAEPLAKALGQPVVIVNKDGAGGTIATAQVASAAPDGYTAAFSTLGPLNLQPHLKKSLPYKSDDLLAVCQAFYNDLVIVTPPQSRYTDLKQVVERAREQPGRVLYGVPGAATVPHFAMLELAQAAQVKMEVVPYRGDPGVVLALKSGDIELGVIGIGSALAQDLRILAVLSPSRVGEAPDIPTALELGYSALGRVYAGIYAPKGIPAAAMDKLQSACKAAVTSAPFIAAAKSMSTNASYADGAAFQKTIVEGSKRNAEAIRAAGLTLEK